MHRDVVHGERESEVTGVPFRQDLLVPDGAYTFGHDKPHFHRASVPSPTELRQLLDTMIVRITGTVVQARRKGRPGRSDLVRQLPVA